MYLFKTNPDILQHIDIKGITACVKMGHWGGIKKRRTA
jgi:hypothetical protein